MNKNTTQQAPIPIPLAVAIANAKLDDMTAMMQVAPSIRPNSLGLWKVHNYYWRS